MRFAPDEDQLALREAIGVSLVKLCDAATVRRAWDAGSAPMLRGLWSELTALGVPSVLAPESVGGLGLGWVTAVLILEEVGRAAVPLPLLETMAVVVPTLVASGDPGAMLPSVLEGRLILSASVCLPRPAAPVVDGSVGDAIGADHPLGGGGHRFPGGTIADGVLIGCGERVAVYRIDQLSTEPVDSVDRARHLAKATPFGDGVILPGATAAQANRFGALAAAAELIGLGARMLDLAVEHVKGRTQFGVPIGSFQAVKHRLADVLLALEFARPAVWNAAYAIDHDLPDVDRAISMAKAMASDASAQAAGAALQCHGAMGYTDEYDLHLWMKRSWALAAAYGGAAWHRDQVGRALGI